MITRDEAWTLLKKYNEDPFHLQHALTVEAVMDGDEELAVEALMLHPLVNSYSLAKKLIADYDEAYGGPMLGRRAKN